MHWSFILLFFYIVLSQHAFCKSPQRLHDVFWLMQPCLMMTKLFCRQWPSLATRANCRWPGQEIWGYSGCSLLEITSWILISCELFKQILIRSYLVRSWALLIDACRDPAELSLNHCKELMSSPQVRWSCTKQMRAKTDWSWRRFCPGHNRQIPGMPVAVNGMQVKKKGKPWKCNSWLVSSSARMPHHRGWLIVFCVQSCIKTSHWKSWRSVGTLRRPCFASLESTSEGA